MMLVSQLSVFLLRNGSCSFKLGPERDTEREQGGSGGIFSCCIKNIEIRVQLSASSRQCSPSSPLHKEKNWEFSQLFLLVFLVSYSKKGFSRTGFFLELFSFSRVQNTQTVARALPHRAAVWPGHRVQRDCLRLSEPSHTPWKHSPWTTEGLSEFAVSSEQWEIL